MKRQQGISELIGVRLDELERIQRRLAMMDEELAQTVDACINGELEVTVSSAVCLLHFSLELRGLTDRLNSLMQSTRERFTQAQKLTDRLRRLKR